MYTNQYPLLDRLIGSLKGMCPPEEIEYLLGVYYLEFGKTYMIGQSKYIETNVSFRRARRHLKRALRLRPQDAEILTSIGESYAKGRWPAIAFKYYEKALALVPNDARLVWNLMEQSYLLSRYALVLSHDAKFHWETCIDDGRYFWCGVLCAYSAAALGDTNMVRDLADRVLKHYTPELPQCDIAAACMLDILYLSGEMDALKKQYKHWAQQVASISTPLLMFVRKKKEWPAEYKLTLQVLSAFTPRNLLPHLAG